MKLISCFLSLALLPGFLSAEDVDPFGGSLATKLEATGFFRTEEIGDRWYFVTPEGHPWIALGANHVGSFLKTQAADGGLFSRHGDDPEKAADALLETLWELGLTAGDAYQPDARFAERIPWVHAFHYNRLRGKQPPNVFDEEAMQAMQAHVKAECAKIADNPWVIGVAGPDLPRWDSSYVHPYRIAEAGSSRRMGYEAFLQERHESIESLNAAHGTKFPSWEALAEKPRLNFEIESEAALADEEAFLGLLASRHFAAVRAACKEGAPNHLYLGERTQLRVIPDAVLKEMGKHIDVFCTQSLIRLPKDPPEWQLFQAEHYAHEYALVQRPTVIIDWAAPFTLGDAEVETEYGTLRTEAQAGEDAASFVRDAFEQSYMVGLFICQAIGTHGNDKFFSNAKRTYLKDDGTLMTGRSVPLREANLEVIQRLYAHAAEES